MVSRNLDLTYFDMSVCESLSCHAASTAQHDTIRIAAAPKGRNGEGGGDEIFRT